MNNSLTKRLLAEGLGTLLLLAVVVGSGIMGDALSTDDAVALWGNTAATGAILFVLITILGPISGAHFNPAVTLVFWLRKELSARDAALYVAAQLGGAVLGVFLAHAMFDLPVMQISVKLRSGLGQLIAESVATFGLLLTILGCLKFKPAAVPAAVGLYITAGYWFTASTSFANPAVTIARILTDTFSGIAPEFATGFILSQMVGALLAFAMARILFADNN